MRGERAVLAAARIPVTPQFPADRGRAAARPFRDLGLEIRAGLHTGEVERRQHSVAGLAVHIGTRVASLAAAGEGLVTSVVRAMVLGSGIAFADRGIYSLKGAPDTWQLYAAI